MSWLALHPADYDDDDDDDDDDEWWLDATLRRMSDTQQSRQTRNSSPFTKRMEDYQRRRVDPQEENRAGEDWDSNGWVQVV